MSKFDTILRTAATGAVLTISLAGTAQASVGSNPFGVTALESGYRLADAGESKCGANAPSAKAAEAKCGTDAAASKVSEGKCGAANKEESTQKTIKEAKCGEAKCGGNR